jgi:hypothetical protein
MQLGITARNAQCAAVAAALVNGYIRCYDGTMPATPETATAGTNHVLAELRFDATTPFADPVSGVMTAHAITQDSSADVTGTATWFRAYKADGTTVVFQGTISLDPAPGDIKMSKVAVEAGSIVRILSLTYTVPA